MARGRWLSCPFWVGVVCDDHALPLRLVPIFADYDSRFFRRKIIIEVDSSH
jgi:hypothetical protein